MIDLPQPLTPADCNLRGLPYMPMMVSQVMQSETYALSTGDEFKAAFALWFASWLEVPAASLPNDDRMLEFLSRAKSWKKVKAIALRGWVLCSDGRLYHPVVATRALEAWDKRTVYRDKEDSKTDRQRRWREQCKQWAAQLHDLGVVPPKGASLKTLRSLLKAHGVDTQTSTDVDADVDADVDGVDAGEMPKEERVKGELTTPTPPGGETVPSRSVQISVLLRAMGIQATTAHPLVCMTWADDPAVTDEVLKLAVATAVNAKPGERIPVNYLENIVRRLAHPPAAKGSAPTEPPKKDWL